MQRITHELKLLESRFIIFWKKYYFSVEYRVVDICWNKSERCAVHTFEQTEHIQFEFNIMDM